MIRQGEATENKKSRLSKFEIITFRALYTRTLRVAAAIRSDFGWSPEACSIISAAGTRVFDAFIGDKTIKDRGTLRSEATALVGPTTGRIIVYGFRLPPSRRTYDISCAYVRCDSRVFWRLHPMPSSCSANVRKGWTTDSETGAWPARPPSLVHTHRKTAVPHSPANQWRTCLHSDG